MSILIKGMEMPAEGSRTITIHSDGSVYFHRTAELIRHRAVSVPTPHGRLIDADKLAWYHKMYVADAPTIIEAEE